MFRMCDSLMCWLHNAGKVDARYDFIDLSADPSVSCTQPGLCRTQRATRNRAVNAMATVNDINLGCYALPSCLAENNTHWRSFISASVLLILTLVTFDLIEL